MLKRNPRFASADERFRFQEGLIASSSEDVDICDLLEAEGLGIDDLIYRNSRTRSWKGRKPRELESFEKIADGVPLVSFFTGCGGMDLGLEAVGFEHVAAFEHNEIFCRTLRKNRPSWRVFGPPIHNGDVSKVDEVADALAPLVTTPFEGVFIGGPPCQPFSIAANQRFARWGDNFKRVGFKHATNGNLLFDFIALILDFRPKAFVIENVPGLRDLDGGEQLSVAIDQLTRVGYRVAEPVVLDAADHGIPQYRQRMFVVGSRGQGAGSFTPPKKQEHIGASSVLDDLPKEGALNHETRRHKVGSIARYMVLDYGQRDQLGRVDRLTPDKPSKTVIAGGTNGGGRSHLHPEIPRTLSVRECARLQTFPDGYAFVGPTARQFTQVGNAVPPVLAAQIATQLVKAYF